MNPSNQAITNSLAAAEAFNKGNQAFRERKWQLALNEFDISLSIDPDLEPAALQRARCLVNLGYWIPAREAFSYTLRRHPNNYSAWLEAGHLCRQMGELIQAQSAYQRAIAVIPDRYEAPLGLARVLEQSGQADAGEQAYQYAQRVAINASSMTVLRNIHHRMGLYRLEQGNSNKALMALQSALAVTRTDSADINDIAEIQIDLGETLLRLGRRNDALEILTAASIANGESTLARLAALSFRHNLWQEALEVSRRNVELHPTSPWPRWNLAHLLAECWSMEEAEIVLRQAEALAPMPGARSMRASIAGRQGDAETALALYRELALEPGAALNLASSAAMSSLYSDQLSAQQVADLHRELFSTLGKDARPVNSFVRPPLSGRRLKLGIVSADFHHQHPVNIFMQPLLREWDKNRFEIFLYFTGVSYDDQTQLAKQRVEHWIESTTFNDIQLAKRIDADGVDILLDLAGHTGQQRMTLFAKRAAPIQVTYLGYPGSTGVPNVDWLLGDNIVTPIASESLYSERIARFPGTVFCFAPETDYPYPRYDENWLQRPLTFGSFNNVPKLTPHTLSLWARILAVVPNSRLLLKAPSFSDSGAVKVFSDRLKNLGVNLSRVEFRGPVGLTDMMAEYGDVDIALDPVPYNGGTTSLQAMWMGVPLLTKMGNHFVSRMGASFMIAAGLPEWVAKNDDEYVAIAQRMAKNRQGLLDLKRGLRGKLMNCLAWDVISHTRWMETILWSIAEKNIAPVFITKAPIRCIGITCVRDEADVIEWMVRYNLKFLDELHVIDNLSVDKTRWILEQLQAEGLPLHIHYSDDPEHNQVHHISRLARELALADKADYFIPLDGDELIAASHRNAFHQGLTTIPVGYGGIVHWQTYLPPPSEQANRPDFFRTMKRYRSHELFPKVILQREACLSYNWSLGHHNAFSATGDSVPTVYLPFRLAHFPVRSAEQIAKKVVIGAHALAKKANRRGDECYHWIELVTQLHTNAYQPIVLDIEKVALHYGCTSEQAALQKSLEGRGVTDFPDIKQRYPTVPVSLATVLENFGPVPDSILLATPKLPGTH